MERIKSLAKSMLTAKNMMTALVVIIFIASAVFAYNKYVKPRMAPDYAPNKEFSESSNNSEAVIYYFTASWCPVSKRVLPQWEKFVEDYQGKTINGYKLQTRFVDCEKETDLADKFAIEEYPTIKLAYDNHIVEYDANVKYSTLVEFVTTSLDGNQ